MEITVPFLGLALGGYQGERLRTISARSVLSRCGWMANP